MQQVASTSAWRRVASEPLAHFVAIGLVLFAVDAWRSGADEAAVAAPPRVVSSGARAPIIVDGAARERVAERAERRLGQAPTAAELAVETERWIDEEVLYREALERELQRDDPMIHERLAARMSYVLEQAAIVPEPSEPELRAWFASHRERWSVPARIDFTHVFVADGDEARAATLLTALEGGARPERLGDRFVGGRRYRGRRLADLALAFGEPFTVGLEAQALGVWHQRRSRFGLHVVRVERREAGRAATFADARLDVRREWLEARRGAEVSAAVARVRAGWEIRRP
jgi:hypothetical protein